MTIEVSDDLRTELMEINFGPHHPSTHGIFRFIATLDGEVVVDIEPYIGYLHRGIEKLAENKKYMTGFPLYDRLDYIASLTYELCFCLALEKLMEIEVPERAQFIRVILVELQRISTHLIFYATTGLEAGAYTPFLYAFREREAILRLLEMATGARMTTNYFRIGGVKWDLPEGFEKELRKLLSKFPSRLEEYDQLLTGNEIFCQRMKNIGILGPEIAINIGVSGPTLRGSGVRFDLRKAEPYSGYDRFDFDIPYGLKGDAYDRYLVRLQEMRQCLRIISQAIDGLPGGDFRARVPKVIKPPAGEVYMRTEGTRGELGFYIISDGSANPYKVKIRAPSFVNIMALKPMVVGHTVPDLILIFGSIDIVMGEIDR
ncbi:NADH-quinone oxidoreductase subunit D [Candidatus Hakubella thermalkaliphila]|uniref:NADH-quinone oxidoreductase subunit D n=1 Tax=Candidatus Hakubella thermalkaliphila TaxID=2754717 RepID=A0A6V8NE94_9ACTN|nr:NADH-quinone oxidoreductase subunit D [Candidatus Hakubella thermalkaliphila]GFP18565.1 NADH-quinone oxidoreductase subunit D [Candidatus Hakubella thermalkaliphila]GFP23115.1 NADH-quinone oxidoreductase subunit D [Candidatus Hakubella thermalkaliphila]GFP30186.1 NADH-quinone oxidoreductase subunit D [Candidatus Hakubella thermalkaliphila]GFP37059.1 NADH-quinone oxidoreductase subunit D [Candidatus Hakubella thermalkaliphila]GFP38656.1 NADH-quinone oxidoreductase subunit D [Candidatus Hakub